MNEYSDTMPFDATSLRRWAVFLSGSLLFFYSFMQLNILSSIGEQIMHDFKITSTQLGHLSSFYFYANFFFVFPAGLLLDRFSTRKLLLLAMSLAVVSMFGFALSDAFYTAGLFRFISGLGGAFCFVSCVKLASQWFPSQKMALAIGLLSTMGMLGGMVAQTPMALLSGETTWRYAMLMLGLLGIVCIAIIWLVVEDRPMQNHSPLQEQEKLEWWWSIRTVLFNRHNWLAGLFTALINLPVFLLGALWGNLFLTQAEGLTSSQASYVTSTLFIGMLVGSPLMGLVSDRIGKRRLPMFIGIIVSLVIISIVLYTSHLPIQLLVFLFFLLGIASSTQTLSYSLVTELNSPLVTSSANGIISMMLMASGFVFQPLFGKVMDWGKGFEEMVVPLYSARDFFAAMHILPLAFLISFVALFFLQETHCQRQGK